MGWRRAAHEYVRRGTCSRNQVRTEWKGEILSAADPSRPRPSAPLLPAQLCCLFPVYKTCRCKYSSLSCRIPPDPIICAVVTAPNDELPCPGLTLSPPPPHTDTVLNNNHHNWPSLSSPVVQRWNKCMTLSPNKNHLRGISLLQATS